MLFRASRSNEIALSLIPVITLRVVDALYFEHIVEALLQAWRFEGAEDKPDHIVSYDLIGKPGAISCQSHVERT